MRTLQRWTQTDVFKADARTTVTRPTPSNALSDVERQAIITLCNSPEYAHLPPSQIVPRLADQGCYLASEATFYRVLRAAGQQQRRGRSQRPRRYAAPTTHAAKAPNQVWSWDITYPRQNGLAVALRELGRIERTLFILDWLQSVELRRRVHAGLNKGEARNALARAVFFNRLGEIRDRSFEQ
ncbi:ISAfe5, transposase orfB, partial [Pseudomonas syringae pv. actinidiae ICMP 19070]